MYRLLPIGCWLALALAACAGAPARAQTEAYCSITSVTAEQLSNAVRIRLEADGTLEANIRRWWSGAAGGYYLDWARVNEQTSGIWSADCYPQVDRVLVHLDNALSRAGSVVSVNRYPVSLVRLVMAPEGNEQYGLDIEVVLHKRMRIRRYAFGEDQMGWDAYLLDHRDPAWFEMVLSPDRRSLIITVASDRLPEARERRSLRHVPEASRELQVHGADGKLTVHARNAALSEVAEAVSRESELQLVAGEGAASRVITAEVSDLATADFAARLAECYGLVLSEGPGRVTLSDAGGETTASQAAIVQTAVPVRNLRAAEVAGLLPNFLVDYMRVDDQNNTLLVSGPRSLAEKVSAAVAALDQPPAAVSLQARVLEASSLEEVTGQLALRDTRDGQRLTIDAAAGDVTYLRSEALPDEFEARLRALTASGGAEVCADASVVVLSGETGEVFSGEDRYILIFRRLYDPAPTIEPVQAGVKLAVTPRAGGEAISMSVDVAVQRIEAVDPVSRLPVVSSLLARGAFRLRPGETAVIGGISQRRGFAARRKTPVLGDLPLVGGVSRARRGEEGRTEMLVLLTPTLTDGRPAPGAAPAATPVAVGRPPGVLPSGGARAW